jgi:hypothetical protein
MPSAESEPQASETSSLAGDGLDPSQLPFNGNSRSEGALRPIPPLIARWVKTECGRAKYQLLAGRRGPWGRLRLWWFVGIAALRDWRLPVPTDGTGSA